MTTLLSSLDALKEATTTPMWRHGDIMVAAVPQLPDEAFLLPSRVLSFGEATGHAHRIEDSSTSDLYERNGARYIDVHAREARLVHDEHKPIVLPQGIYRFWHQREYTPTAIVRVVD